MIGKKYIFVVYMPYQLQITRHSLPTRMRFKFFYPPHKNFEMPTHIAHIAKAPRANAETKALSKSAILPTHRRNIDRIKYYEL